MEEVFFYPRAATDTVPAGMTVSKQSTLLERKDDFVITSYSWGDVELWFVDEDEFTADERQFVCEAWCKRGRK